MRVIDYDKKYFEDWADMAFLLFKDYQRDFIETKLKKLAESTKHKTFFVLEGELVLGYVTGSIRSDYVEGSNGSPTGYLEMIFVKDGHRKKGLAKKLYEKVEKWALENGCSQMGSDTWEWNKTSRDFHKQLGFKEEEVLVHFIKNI